MIVFENFKRIHKWRAVFAGQENPATKRRPKIINKTKSNYGEKNEITTKNIQQIFNRVDNGHSFYSIACSYSCAGKVSDY